MLVNLIDIKAGMKIQLSDLDVISLWQELERLDDSLYLQELPMLKRLKIAIKKNYEDMKIVESKIQSDGHIS